MMGAVTTSDGTQIYYKDWGNGSTVVLSHGWPLFARRRWEGPGIVSGRARLSRCRPRPPSGLRPLDFSRGPGADYYMFADNLATLFQTLDLKDVALFGFSMGQGEVARYIGRHGTALFRCSEIGLDPRPSRRL